MKVLHLAESSSSGGASISLMRLHRRLVEDGHSSRVLVDKTGGGGVEAAQIPPQSLLSRLSYHGLNLLGLNYAGILGTARRIAGHPFFREADVVHIHNIHGGYFNYLALPALSRLKPLLWTLRDMWALTGHCAHSFDCSRWRTGCGRCPYPKTYPPVRVDSTGLDWRLKRWAYSRSRIVVTCPSRWLTELARQSTLGRFPVRQIDNGLDTGIYRPLDRRECRSELDLPQDRLVILFAAQSMRDQFKNPALLLEAVRGLDEGLRKRCLLLMLGRDGPSGDDVGGIPIVRLGFIGDDRLKAKVYSASDLFAYPTKADNQPLVLLESMACGCPMASVDVGGVPELVLDGDTGMIARAGDAGDFRRAIGRLLGDDDLRRALSSSCRERAVKRYDIGRCASRMAEAYAEAVDGWRSAVSPLS